jgi:hypothetical protein
MAKRKTTLALEEVKTTVRRKDRASLMKEFEDDGWEILDDSRTVTRKVNEWDFFSHPVHNIPRNASKYDIFTALLPPDFAFDVFLERARDRDMGLCFSKGGNNIWTVDATEDLAMRLIAIRLQVHATMDKKCGYKAGIKKAVEALRVHNNGLEGAWILQRLLSMYYFEFDSIDELRINDNLRKIFSSLGDRFAGDEKLFKFAGLSGYVRMVPNKPAKIGLWNFQGTVILKCGLPFLIYSRMHITLAETQRSMKCIEIIQDWGQIIIEKEFQKKTMLFIDSYYLTKDAGKWLKEHDIMYVGAMQKQRFKNICSVIEPTLEKSGTSEIAYNRSTGEPVAYCWSENKKLGKKFVHSNGYKLEKKAKKDTSCAPYDNYKTGFVGCDRFNKLLANKNWPHVVKSDRHAASNYIFVCIVLNAFHLVWTVPQQP